MWLQSFLYGNGAVLDSAKLRAALAEAEEECARTYLKIDELRRRRDECSGSWLDHGTNGELEEMTALYQQVDGLKRVMQTLELQICQRVAPGRRS